MLFAPATPTKPASIPLPPIPAAAIRRGNRGTEMLTYEYYSLHMASDLSRTC